MPKSAVRQELQEDARLNPYAHVLEKRSLDQFAPADARPMAPRSLSVTYEKTEPRLW